MSLGAVKHADLTDTMSNERSTRAVAGLWGATTASRFVSQALKVPMSACHSRIAALAQVEGRIANPSYAWQNTSPKRQRGPRSRFGLVKIGALALPVLLCFGLVEEVARSGRINVSSMVISLFFSAGAERGPIDS